MHTYSFYLDNDNNAAFFSCQVQKPILCSNVMKMLFYFSELLAAHMLLYCLVFVSGGIS